MSSKGKGGVYIKKNCIFLLAPIGSHDNLKILAFYKEAEGEKRFACATQLNRIRYIQTLKAYKGKMKYQWPSIFTEYLKKDKTQFFCYKSV